MWSREHPRSSDDLDGMSPFLKCVCRYRSFGSAVPGGGETSEKPGRAI